MFLVLLVQSAAVMFSPPPEAGGEIDIIVRTSSASIFGYLLSGGLYGSAAGESASPGPADQCDAENHRQAFSQKRESPPVVFSAASAGEARRWFFCRFCRRVPADPEKIRRNPVFKGEKCSFACVKLQDPVSYR